MHQLRRRFRRRSDDFETVELRVQMISPRASKNYRDTDQHGSLPTISAHMEVGKGPCRLESGCDHSAIQGKGSRTICSSYTAISAGQGLRPCALRTSAAPSHTSAETAEIWFYAQSFDNIPHTGVASPGWAASWISKTVACGLHWYQGCLQFGGPPGTVESISCHRSSTIPDSAHPHGTTSRVRVGWKLSKAFNTSSSVRQGCVLAPALLLSGNWLDHVQMFGQSWRYSRWSSVNRPQLCDDAVLFAQDPGRWQAELKRFDDVATTMSLHTLWAKIKLPNIGHGPPPQSVSVDGHLVEGSEKFVYLGSTVDSTGYSSTDILRRLGLATSVMGQLDRVWRQNWLSLATKLRILRQSWQ